jgi:flagella basal body P-ring formation protein FlgA
MMLLALLAVACLPVAGPNITAQEIAAAVPGFTPSEATIFFSYAPTPGVQRVVHPAELQQFLMHQQFTGTIPTHDVCFERPTTVLTEGVLKKAMQDVLGTGAHIELVDWSRFPAPPGQLVFPRSDLGTPPIALWRGYVQYDGTKKFPIWARVKLSVRVTRIVAAEDLRPGVPIRAAQVILQASEDFPGPRITASDIAMVVGAIPRRFINANSPVWETSIDPPNEVTKGDRVSVTVHSGLARLTFDAEAESSGRRGDVLPFKNPESGKLFRARVDGPGTAALETHTLTP